MYIRITKAGGHEYAQLVESFREGGKVRKRVIANLGRVDEIKRNPRKLESLAGGVNGLMGRAENSVSKFDFNEAPAYGNVFALDELWKDLEIDKALKRALRSGRRETDAHALIKAMVFNRLCAPCSKLSCIDWLETVAIPDMPRKVGHQQLLRSMDALMQNAERVEEEFAQWIRPLVDFDLTVAFHDLTTIRISGEKENEDDLRRYGKSKETGGIARQFVLGVVQTSEGLPLAHMVHPGNIAETKTLKDMARTVMERFPIRRVVLVADRGLLSYDNIDELSEMVDEEGRKLEFILAVPSRRYKELAETFASLQFNGDGNENRRGDENEDGEKYAEAAFRGCRLIVAHDPVRARERTEDRRARIDRLEARARTLSARTEEDADGRRVPHDEALAIFAVEVGKARLKKFFRFGLGKDDGRFFWTAKEGEVEKAELFDGKLALVTNVEDIEPADAIARYKALADIERGFRVLKSDIEIAPVYHWLNDRIRAHALICFLALVLYRVMRMRLKAGGIRTSPCRALKKLSKIRMIEARIGGRVLDAPTKTDKDQRDLFEKLKLPKPV